MRREAFLPQSEDNFRIFIETIDEIIHVGDLEGNIIYSNPAATAKLGYSPDQLCTMHILDLHPEFLRKEASAILSAMIEGKRKSCPLPLIDR